jgi:hypothetical protein
MEAFALNRALPCGLLLWLALLLSACTPPASTPLPTAAFPPEAVASQVAENLTAAAPSLQSASTTTALADSGLLVVYEKAGSLWAWRSSGKTQITSSSEDHRPRLSADGQWVAFQRGAELWVVASSGENPRKLYGEAGVVPLQFEFAPASHKLYFTTATAEGAPRFDLNLADLATNSIRVLLPPGQGGEFTFQPDGSQLALVQPDKIFVAQADGTEPRVVHKFAATLGLSGNYLPKIAWLENGYGFKTVLPGRPTRFLFVMSAGGTPAQLAEFPAAPASVSDTFIAPDGSKLTYLKDRGGDLELHVIDASTADKTYFAYPRDKFGLLGWTPDSKNLLFWIDDPRQAWIAAGDQRFPLSDVAYASQVTWIDAETYLFLNESELRLRRMGQPSQVLDTEVTGSFDAVAIR